MIALGRGAGALLVAILLIVTAACAPTAEEAARPLELPPTTTDSGTGDVTGPRTGNVVVWLVRRDLLFRVLREVTDPPSAEMLLEELVDGPTRGEAARGVRTLLTEGDARFVVTPTSTPATVDAAVPARILLSDDLRARPLAEQVLALGQLVLTLRTAGYDAVEFVGSDGEPVAVPAADGRIITGPATADDYLEIRTR